MEAGAMKWPEFRELATVCLIGTITDSLVTSWIFATYGYRAEIAEGNPVIKLILGPLGYLAPIAHAPLEFAQGLAGIVIFLYLEQWIKAKKPKWRLVRADMYAMALYTSIGPFVGALSWIQFH